MLKLQELAIRIPRQQCGSSELTYHLDETFFQLFEHSLIKKGHLIVRMDLEKSASHIQLLFDIQGTIELICDRSLAHFDYPIVIERLIYFKLGPENKELDVDLYVIEQGAATIDVAQPIYDFVTLAIPMKKLHPRFNTTA